MPNSNILQDTQVVTERDFFVWFEKDLNRARGQVLIQSPFLAQRRIGTLSSVLSRAINRGVRICVFVQKPRRSSEDFENRMAHLTSAACALRALGAHVSFRHDIHEKLAIIDDCILWDGSLNILSQSRSTERMTRWQSCEKVLEALKMHNLHECDQCEMTSSPKLFLAKPEEHLAMLGADFARIRKRRGLSQSDLHRMTGVPTSIISQFECGKRSIKVSTVFRLFRVLGLVFQLSKWYDHSRLPAEETASQQK